MAGAQTTIDLIFNGVDKTGAATVSALNNLQKFSSGAQNITQPIADVTLGAVKLELALLSAGAAVTLFAVKTAGDFDTAFREIATLLGQPISDLGAFREAILSYATTSTAPLEQVTTAVYNAISAGVPLERSLEAVAAAEKLAVAGKADLNDTLRVLVSSLNAYGLTINDAGRFSDALFTAVRLGQTTLPELASGLAQVTGAAAAVGVPFETVLAALSTLTAQGTPTAQAVTQINAVLTSLLKPSSEAAKLSQELGIEFNGQAVRAKGLEGVLADVAKATGGNQEQMARLFGSVEAVKAVFPLTGASAQKFASDLAEMGKSAGATDAAFGKMADAISLSSQQAANAFKTLMVAIGSPLLDEFGGIAKAVGAIFAALGDSVRAGGLGGVVAYVETLFKDLQATLETVARNLPKALEQANFGRFTDGIKAVADAFGRLFSGIDLRTVDGLTRAIELAGAAFLGLSKFTAGVIDSFKPLFDLLVRLGSQIDGINPDWLEFAGNIGGAVTQFNFLLGAIGGLVPALQVLVGLMVANQGLSLLAGIKGIVAILPAMTGALTVAGVAFAGAFAIDKVVQIIDGLVQLRRAQEDLSAAQERGRIESERSADTLQRFTETTGLAVKTIDEAMQLVDSGQVVWSDAANGWVQVGSAMDTAATAADKIADPFRDANQAILDNADAAAKAEDAAKGFGQEQKGVATYTTQIVEIIDEATGKIIGYEQRLVATAGAGRELGKALPETSRELKTSADVMQELGKKTDLTNKELIDLAKNVRDAEVKLEELASNERIKTIEANVKLNVAQIEADTKRIEAAFQSIDNTINSTGSALTSLFGLYANYKDLGIRAMNDIRNQVDVENKLRRDAFELQKKLTQAQIEQIRARTAAINKGDAMIKVDGAGLQPELEAFMWKILRAVQVRVNQQGLEMLMGV